MEQLGIDLIYCVCDFLTLREMSGLALLNRQFNIIVSKNPFYMFCKESFSVPSQISYIMTNLHYFKKFYFHHNIRFNQDNVFECVCMCGYIEIVKWLAKEYPPKNIEHNELFQLTCEAGRFKVAKWLKESYTQINISDNEFNAFKCACGSGNLKIVKWISELCPKIYVKHTGTVDTAIYNNSVHGHLGMWIKEKIPQITREIQNNNYFNYVYTNKYGSMRRYLDIVCPVAYLKYVKRNRHPLFRAVFEGGCIEVANWLIKKSNYQNTTTQEYSFLWACAFNHFAFARWVKEKYPDINVRADHDFCFLISCQRNYLKIANWLTTICSNYIITETVPKIRFEI